MNEAGHWRNNRFIIAMNYLQNDYLRQVYTDTFRLVTDALERLPREGSIENETDRLAIESVGTLMERLPGDDPRTLQIQEAYEDANRRMECGL